MNAERTYRLGTTGFGYPEWKGLFYPAGLKPAAQLGYYARYFNTVELDTTFYAAPTAERVRAWAAAVDDDFRFTVKTPRQITHDDPYGPSAELMRGFLDAVREFGVKLGAVLIQFPPAFGVQHRAALETFLAHLPQGVRFAVELRQRSWQIPQTYALLTQYRCALVAAEYSAPPQPIVHTTDFIYLRLLGRRGQFAVMNREQVDMTTHLQQWKAELERHPDPAAVYGFVANDYSGYAIATCQRFRHMLGLAAPDPPAVLQGTLFE